MTQTIIAGLQQLSPYIYFITDIFIIISLLVFLLAFFQRNQKDSPLVARAPGWLIGLGIFGTLLGVAVGLSQFNAQGLEQSIPKLFDGLAMAVITGMVGLSLALLLRWICTPKTQPTQLSRSVTPSDIHEVLKEICSHNVAQKTILSTIVEQTHTHQQNLQKILKLQQHNGVQLVNLLENLQAKLVDEQDNSLLTQLHQLRLVLEEIQAASKNYYFSGNLNEAVTGIEQSRDALREIATHTQAIPQTMQQLTQLIHGFNYQLEEMALYLETFQTLRQQAGEAFPVLEKNFLELTKMMQQEMQHHLEWLETAMETQLDMAEVALEHQLEKVSALQLSSVSKWSSEAAVLPAPKTESQPVEPTMTAAENLAEENLENKTEPSMSESAPQTELVSKSAREEEQKMQLNSHENLVTPPENRETEDWLTHERSTLETSSAFKASEKLANELSLTNKEWQEQAYQFMDAGEYDKAIICFQRAIEYTPTDFALYYNQACCHALLKNAHLAVSALQQAIHLNKACFEMAQTDSDFDSIRHDADFQSLWC